MRFCILANTLEKTGFEVTYLPVNEAGLISIADLQGSIAGRYDFSFGHVRQ